MKVKQPTKIKDPLEKTAVKAASGHTPQPKPFIIDEPFYTIEDTATLLGVEQVTVYAYIRRQKLASIKIGRDYAITVSAIEDLMHRKESVSKNQMIKRAERKIRHR